MYLVSDIILDLKNKFRFPNRKYEQSKAKRMHEPSLDKSRSIITQIKSLINPTPEKINKSLNKRSQMHFHS